MSEPSLLKKWLCASVAYDEPKNKYQLPEELRFDLVSYQVGWSEDAKDFFFVAQYSDHVIVSFRGTDTKDAINERAYKGLIKRWISNLNVRPLVEKGPWGEGTIHRGFYKSWLKIKYPLMRALTSTGIRSTGKPIYFMGHSRGGPFAILAARHLVKNLDIPWKRVNVDTFGSPNLLTYEGLWDYINLHLHFQTNRYINGWDAATRVPRSLYCPGSLTRFRQPKIRRVFGCLTDHLPRRYDEAVLEHKPKDESLVMGSFADWSDK